MSAAPKPPFVPGYDIVGRVLHIGPSVTTVRPGDRVAALTLHGSYAEIVYLPESDLYPVPEELDPAEAVAVILNYMTAYQMLHRTAEAKAGSRVLIHGAAGGVGTALLQLGAAAGLRMAGAAGDGERERLLRYAADAVDSRRSDLGEALRKLAPEGYDVVIEGTGGPQVKQSVPLLGRGGKLVVYGVAHLFAGGRRRAQRAVRTYAGLAAARVRVRLRGNRSHIYSITASKKRHPEWFAEDLSRLFDLLRDRRIAPVIAARMPLSEARRAHELLERQQAFGKIVLLPS
ncbi:zinc-binding dehydrogenase [Cohnella nanjingensis]|uniref:Zinc-binding dehydrogenase n=1 Tax=Cohnella nanjingensis TaxID=1387779 RepID=A0A7X0RLT5_9BACL|nr:zinc-binding dehydrogenase [Cohnella nanjingensis]MBB6669882.1 zinc-binding dehydrogenase [Cohnella nanjingensis]